MNNTATAPKSAREEVMLNYSILGDRIVSPGKFEGEPIFAPYYWNLGLEGLSDFDDGNLFKFNVGADGGCATPRLPENGSGFTADVAPITYLPEGFALVNVSQGGHETATLYVPAANLALMLPPSLDLTGEEWAVLVATKSYKPVCRREYCAEVGVSHEAFSRAQAGLISRGLMNKAGAITTDGRNAVIARYGELGSWYKLESEIKAGRTAAAEAKAERATASA